MAECAVCHSKLVSPTVKTISKAYDRHRSKISLKQCALNVLLVVGDCMLIGLLPVLVFMSKVDGKFKFSPAARNNMLLAVPALLYAINNYLKFIMQLYFNPATVKMLSNLKSAMGDAK